MILFAKDVGASTNDGSKTLRARPVSGGGVNRVLSRGVVRRGVVIGGVPPISEVVAAAKAAAKGSSAGAARTR